MNHHHRSPAPPPLPPPPLTRYESAPSSFFADLPPAGSEAMMTHFFSGAGDSCLTTSVDGAALQRSYCLADVHVSPPPAPIGGRGTPLQRHSSSPAGFFSTFLVDPGCSGTVQSLDNRRLRSEWSFSRQDSLSQISELSIPEIGENVTCGNNDAAYISSNIQLGTWDDNSIFSAPNKRAKDNNGNIVRSLSNIESQLNMPANSLDYLRLQPDSVPCRVRAKRGCATHPRSIAERERRTRISKRLQKLQDLVPNMEKETSTSDMLELAVKHITELQNQLQRLKQDQANCTCGGNQVSTRA